MSFGQQRLWFAHQLEPEHPHHALGRVYEVRGPLDLDALQEALRELVRRHEPLRTTFHFEEGRPLQRVHAEMPTVIERVDCTGRTRAEAWEAVDARLTRDLHARFDPAEGPVLRATAVEVGRDEWALIVTQRFIGADRWSRAIVQRELSQLYAAFRAGQPSPLDPLPLRYLDFAAWQRERLQGRRLDALLDYWTSRLSGVGGTLVPADAPRSEVSTRLGATVYRRLPVDLSAHLSAIAAAQRVTPFMLYLAAFFVVLGRWSGDEDLVVGVPVAGRLRPETEELVGFFGNTLMLRADVSGDPAFTDLLRAVRRTSLDAFTHQDLPFERLIEALPVERDLSDPLAHVLFAFQNLPDAPLRLAGCDVREREGVSDTFAFHFGLSLYPEASEAGAGLLLRAQYQADRYRRATVDGWLAQFESVLRAIAEDPGRPLSRLAATDTADRDRQLAWADGPRPPWPSEALVHRLVAAQAARTPDAVALAWNGGSLTFTGLQEHARLLGGRLHTHGVGPETLVAVAMPRSPELVVTLLAVLEAGGAYLPLEHDPPARARRVLEQSAATLLLTDGSLDSTANPGLPVFHVAPLTWEGPPSPPASSTADPGVAVAPSMTAPSPDVAVRPDSLAYVMYTSGSTGEPKGVEVPHRAIVRLVTSGLVPMGPGDVVLHLSAASFDASTFEIWMPLVTGARLVLLPAAAFDLDVFEATVRREGVTHLFLTTALFNTIVDLRPSALEGVRYLLTGGEVMSAAHARAAVERHPQLRLFNVYGPTEVTTFSLVHQVAGPVRADAGIPLGRPIAHTSAYVLDRRRQLLPAGSPGELYLGGAGVARGYRGAPAPTDERFVDLTIAGRDVGRVYRTGDRVRWRPDGALEFLGRADRQVKLRGFRIELDEIETHLLSHPDVVAAAVLLQAAGSPDAHLAASVVPRRGARLVVSDLGAWLAARLPRYMLPSVIHLADSLPLTTGGKLDRRTLVARTTAGQPTSTLEAEPPVVQTMAIVWRGLLDRPVVSGRDNFFDLGGHSLLAVQLVARVRTVFEVEVPLSTIFEHPTLARFAAAVSERRAAREGATAADDPVDAAPIEPAPAATYAPVSFAQRRLWFLHQLEPEGAAYNSHRAYTVRGELDVGALRRACDGLVERHSVLRTTFALDTDEPVQTVRRAAPMPFEFVDLASEDRTTQAALLDRALQAAARRPFDLGAGPVARTLLVRLAPDEHVLSIALHHITIDGWSMRLLSRDLSALYAAARQGQPFPPAPRVQYVDFAAWQRRHVQGARLERLLGYWRAQLRHVPALVFPGEPAGPAPSSLERDVEYRAMTIPANLRRDLEELGRQEGATLFMVLLAAWQAVLAAAAACDDVAVGTPVANRSRPDLEQTVGFFVNTLVLRTSLSGRPTWSALIARVRKVALDAFDHEDCPFDLLVDAVPNAGPRGHLPLVRVLFALQTAADEPLRLEGAEVTRRPAVHVRTRFDLELTLRPMPDGTLSGGLAYRPAQLDAARVDRMTGAFLDGLRAAVENVGQPVFSLDEVAAMGASANARARTTAGRRATPAQGRQAGAFRPQSAGIPAARPHSGRMDGEPRRRMGALTPSEARLARIWRGLLSVEQVSRDDDFFDAGGHSLTALRLFTAIEAEFGRRLPLATLFEHPTLRQLAARIDAGAGAINRLPLVLLREGASRPPVFLVHGIGGEVVGFRDLARHLPDGHAVYGIQAPGPPQASEAPIEIGPACDAYAGAVVEAAPEGPLVVGGFSWGGTLALELARRLRARGREVAGVLVLDGGLPPAARRTSSVSRFTPQGFLREVGYWWLDEVLVSRGREWPAWIARRGRSLERRLRWLARPSTRQAGAGTYLDTHPLPDAYSDMARRRIEAFRRFEPHPWDGPALLVRARTGPLFGAPSDAVDADWRLLLTGPIRAVTIPCAHARLLRPPHVARVASHVASALTAWATSPAGLGVSGGSGATGHASDGTGHAEPAQAKVPFS